MNRKLRRNIFLGECVVILLLIVAITSFINTGSGIAAGNEQEVVSVDDSVKEEVILEGTNVITNQSNGTSQSVVDLNKTQLTDASVEEDSSDEGSSDEIDSVDEDSNSDESVNEIDSTENSVNDETTDDVEAVEGNEASILEVEFIDNSNDGILTIVVFGDSIWDDYRWNNGVSEQLAELTGATVYNCAVGGTSASVTDGSTDIFSWDNRSVNGMLYVARDDIDLGRYLDGYDAKGVMEMVDFTSVDYVIFSYGLNDYFMGAELGIDGTTGIYEFATYAGALRHASSQMAIAYPQAEYIIVGPTLSKVFDGKEDAGYNDTVDNGYGTIADYANAASVAAEETDAYFLDMYNGLGITHENIDVYLRDGVHLTTEGVTLYATRVAEFINELTENMDY